MSAPRVEDADRLARAVLRQRLNVKPKENVTIETYPSALPWATGFVREARRLGARPLLLYEDERSYWAAVEEGRSHLVGSPGEHEWGALEKSDVYVYFWGPEDLARRRRLDEKESEKLVAFNMDWYRVAKKAGLRGARMTIARVTEPNARFFGVPFRRWQDQVLRASLHDPASMRPAARRAAARLESGRAVRIRHPNGTDLTLGLKGRKASVTIGELDPDWKKSRFGRLTSVPDATVYTAVDERTADGTFVANRTTTTGFDAPVDGGRFVFRNGRLARASFARGGSAFREAYAAACAGRDRPSFLEIGLDPTVEDGTPLLEETEAGAVTVGVGRNAGFGGTTTVDFLGYLTLGGADVSVDGRPLIRRGHLVRG
jgi:leucyl aminopeptidase (aminopeptidase T)